MNAQQVNANFEQLFNNLKARNAAQFSKDNDITLSFMFKNEKTIKAGMVKCANCSFSQYVENAANADAKIHGQDKFVAVKVNVKIVRMLDAIGRGSVLPLDEYSQTIVANALHNSGKLLSKSALVCLSSNIEYDELDAQDVLKNRMRKAATTAGTQRSSTRMMLDILELAQIKKGKKGDDIILTDKGRELMQGIFA